MSFHLKPFGWFSHHGRIHSARKLTWQPFARLEKVPLKLLAIQSLAATGAALAIYLLFTRISGGNNALAALAGISAVVYLGLLIESSSLIKMLLNLLAMPLIFTLAYASLSGASMFLIAAFLLHALFAAIQMSGQEKEHNPQLYCWTVYNACLALLLL
jgi:hypothetical protein